MYKNFQNSSSTIKLGQVETWTFSSTLTDVLTFFSISSKPDHAESSFFTCEHRIGILEIAQQSESVSYKKNPHFFIFDGKHLFHHTGTGMVILTFYFHHYYYQTLFYSKVEIS